MKSTSGGLSSAVQCFPTFFLPAATLLSKKDIWQTPNLFNRYKDQRTVIIGGTPGMAPVRGTRVWRH